MGVEEVAGINTGQPSNIISNKGKNPGKLTELPDNESVAVVGSLIDKLRGLDDPKPAVYA